MVRFGTFLAERQLKPYVSANKYALYPIPSGCLMQNITKPWLLGFRKYFYVLS
jgi:hypothetical protein